MLKIEISASSSRELFSQLADILSSNSDYKVERLHQRTPYQNYEEIPDAIKQMPLSQIKFSTRATNGISNALHLYEQPRTIEGLIRVGYHKLMRCDNVGKKSIDEISSHLADLGLVNFFGKGVG